MRRPSLIIIACIAYLVGLCLGYNFIFHPSMYWLFFILLGALSCFVINKKFRILPLTLVFIIFGAAYTTNYINYQMDSSAAQYNYKKVIVEGTIKGDPYWDKDGNYVFLLSNVVINGDSKSSEVRAKTFSSAAKEGYRVRVEGKMFPIMARPKYQISYAKVDIINFNQPPLVRVKQAFYLGADRAFNGDTSAFMKGILVGSRSSLPQPLQDTLNAVGLSHVVAVSGYNLTILVVLLARLFKKRWLWGSLMASLLLVWSFTILTGMSASIMRAAVMATVFLIASYYGKQVSVLACLALTALVTLLINPTLAVQDIGWQLSFLSLTGIVVLSPIIVSILPKKTKLLSELVAITLSAQIATVPYLLYIFGDYSIVALIANLAIMPIIPILMLLGFGLAIIGIFLPNIAYLLGAPINKLVALIFSFLEYLKLQENFQMVISPSIASLVFWYACLLVLALITYNKKPPLELVSFQSGEQLVR